MKAVDDKVIQLIKDMNEDVYLVGGAVRDYFLGKRTYDKDIIVNNAKKFAYKLAEKIDRHVIVLDSENKIYRIVLADKLNYIDITEPINGSLEDDLKRRDFTINSIAINLKTNEIIDVNNGMVDLNKKLIRMISKENILEDSLRILRGYRFSATLGFDIEDDTKLFLNNNLDEIKSSAIERINYELMKLFDGKYTSCVLLEASRLIEILYPIFTDVKKVPKNSHHHLDLYEHSVETVNQIQKIYENSNKHVKEHLEQIDFGGFSRLAHLKFAGFMHDIGKYLTWTIEGDRHRFIKHDDVGAKLSKEILKNNKFSKKQIEYISCMIKNHIYPSQVVSSENINEKIYMRYIRKMDSNVIDNIILAKADRLSAKGPEITEDVIKENIDNLDKLLEYYLSVKDKLKPLPKLLSGEEIMQIKSMPPSPLLGNLIKSLEQEQYEGNVTTREEAIDFILNYQVD